MLRATILILAAAMTAGAYAQAPRKAPAGDVVGVGNFAHVVADLDDSLGFYRDVLGLKVTTTFPFGPNAAIEKLGNTIGGYSGVAVLDVPGTEIGVELIEYRDIERKAQHPSFVDPGAANLALRLRDLDGVFPKIAAYPGVEILTAGGKPVTIETPNGSIHAVFVQDPDGFVVELAQVASPAADAPEGNVLGGSFEPAVRDSAESVEFYNELLGFDFELGAAFNSNQEMAATAGAPGASFRQSRATIPGTSVAMTLIEFKDVARKSLSGRTQDPGTAILQLRVRDVEALAKKLEAAGVPIVTAGGMPVEVAPGVNVVIARDPNNMLLELIQAAPPG